MGYSRFRLLEALEQEDGRPCDGCPAHDYCATGYACGDFYNWTLTGSGMRRVNAGRYPERMLYARLFPMDFAEVDDIDALKRKDKRLRQAYDRDGDECVGKQQDEVAAQIAAHRVREAERVSA